MPDLELPLGFGMALAQNEAAMKKFESLSSDEKESIIAGQKRRVKGRNAFARRQFGLVSHCI